MGGGNVKIILSVVVILGAGGFLFAQTLDGKDRLTYFHKADEVLVNRAGFVGERIRVGGYVEECSILQKKGTLEYRFEVRPDHPHRAPGTEELKHPEMQGQKVVVTYEGTVPDTFKDNAEVIVTGQLDADGVFRGEELTAKCPSKYEAAEQGMAQMPQQARPAKRDCNEYAPSPVTPITVSVR